MFAESEALSRVRPSSTLVISQKARAMARAGAKVISLAAGEPDFPTPDHVIAAAYQAMLDGHTRYTDVDGIADLKQAVAAKFARENGLNYDLSQINVSPGGKAVIFNAFAATLNPGDEVIVPAPYWVSYPDIVTLVGAQPVVVETTLQDGFRLTPAALAAAITPRTRWIILNGPSNPTGALYDRAALKALAMVLVQHPQIYVLSDDIYEHIVFDGQRFETMAAVEPRLYDRTLTLNGVSKAYSMTGWRIGYAGGSAALIKAMAKVMSHTTTNACSISQWAALAALNGPQDHIAVRAEAFQRRRDLALGILAQAPALSLFRPQGAFYLFAGCGAYLGRRTPGGRLIDSDETFCAALLEDAEVATVPGSAFGLSPWLRMSIAASDDDIAEACRRIVAFSNGLT